MNRQITVYIIEDHEDMKTGLMFIINSFPGFHCIAFSNATEALKAIKLSQPDVILMDINLPDIDGIECTRRIKMLYPSIQIMMCTVFDDSEKIFKALKAGANGYILKRAAGEILIDAIKDLINGGAPMSSEIARKVVSSFREEIPDKQDESTQMLTKRENEILDLLAKGYGNKEVADKLSLSIHTIRTHIYHIYEKLHVRNRVEALNKTGRKIY